MWLDSEDLAGGAEAWNGKGSSFRKKQETEISRCLYTTEIYSACWTCQSTLPSVSTCSWLFSTFIYLFSSLYILICISPTCLRDTITNGVKSLATINRFLLILRASHFITEDIKVDHQWFALQNFHLLLRVTFYSFSIRENSFHNYQGKLTDQSVVCQMFIYASFWKKI